MIKKLTPVLYVDAIEPQLELWEQRLGFERTASVPHGDRLGFVILARGGAELMLQTHESVKADVEGLHDPSARMSAGLYAETDDLDACAAALDGIPLVVPRRFTFYGAEELGVRSPSWHPVVFARFPGPPPAEHEPAGKKPRAAKKKQPAGKKPRAAKKPSPGTKPRGAKPKPAGTKRAAGKVGSPSSRKKPGKRQGKPKR